MDELKPCPFCGSTKVKVDGTVKSTAFTINHGLDVVRYSVRCNKCHARGSVCSGYTRNAIYTLSEYGKKLLGSGEQIKSRAIEAWNRRADDGKEKSDFGGV